ncbi:MAG TPA: copper resistance protein CopZ [Lachnospiraceae bacterium]|nr:copper resistance protein CopZ [Lachnospiraceae bacterium]
MSPTISTVIVVVLLVVILFFAIKNSIPHFKGQGACCGGGSSEKTVKPKKLDKVIATKVIRVEGMRCSNCRIRVQNKLNEMDGVNAKVNIEKKTATVQLGKDIPDEELTRAIESLGYHAEMM